MISTGVYSGDFRCEVYILPLSPSQGDRGQTDKGIGLVESKVPQFQGNKFLSTNVLVKGTLLYVDIGN